MEKIATTFHITTVSDDNLSLRTKSGRSMRFKVLERPNELFRYSLARPNLGVYLYSNELGELRVMLQKSILDNWKNAFKRGPVSDKWVKIGRNLCRAFLET